MNPFTNRGIVTDPADFTGRAEQMEEICTRLAKMESTSISSERNIGKSSLIYVVKDKRWLNMHRIVCIGAMRLAS
ncbi:MAG TPA: hypothetical protein PLD20_02845 [Blastocatellia bacterium]|nr:hypothetical protein [Blastocatellia bacterium]HMV84955.1 hypothetical protein [Blastocatellia bacterium]HMX29711.1 hypothetical protein [Blastocatellia bacterium]HMY70659.1 hypothetical protein [Blastocatellia bacterium]HMZ16875.1 hypothetical protein [Blastocatellia bacterium]